MQIEKRNRGGQPGNKNAVGHRSSAPRGNTNAMKHGLFSRRPLGEDDQELIRSGINLRSTDILWECIRLQHAAIIRAQRIMYVKDQADHSRQLISQGSGQNWIKEEYKIQFAQDKQAKFLGVQSMAMSTLRTMIDLYDNLIHKSRDLIDLDRQLRIIRMCAWMEKHNWDMEIDHGEDDFIWAMTTEEGRT